MTLWQFLALGIGAVFFTAIGAIGGAIWLALKIWRRW